MIIVSLRCVCNYDRTSVFIVVGALLLSFVLVLCCWLPLARLFASFMPSNIELIYDTFALVVCLLPMIIAPLVLAYKHNREHIPFIVLADIVSVICIKISVYYMPLAAEGIG
jgi:uncharacterized membrane protein